MLQHERINVIKDILIDDGKVMINDIADRLAVSKVTARKDLDVLIQSGMARKIYGGAIQIDLADEKKFHDLLPLDSIFRAHPLYHKRKEIAEKAVQSVANGDTIFLGSGMTCCMFGKLLKPIENLTVITNNVSALPDLLSSARKVVIVGGEITSIDNTTFFSWSEDPSQYMKNLFVNKAFTSCTGFDLKAGITGDSIVSTYVYRFIPDIKRAWYMLVDHEKFNKIGLYALNSLESVDYVISDHIPKEYLEYFEKKDIAVELTR